MQVDLSVWTQVGPTWQRLYPDGTLGIVRNYNGMEFEFTCEVVSPEGELDEADVPEDVIEDSAEKLMKSLDKRYDPQPEIERRTDTSTYYEHNGKSAFVLTVMGCWYWVRPGITGMEGFGPRTRETVEAEARKHVLTSD